MLFRSTLQLRHLVGDHLALKSEIKVPTCYSPHREVIDPARSPQYERRDKSYH